MIEVSLRRWTALWLALVGIGAPLGVSAQGLPVGFLWETQDGRLLLNVSADDDVEDVTLALRAGRDSWEVDCGDVGAGDSCDDSVPMPSETTTYDLEIRGTYADEPAVLTYEFTVEVMQELAFEVDESTFDAAGRRFTLEMNQPAGRVEVSVRGESGNVIAERVIEFHGEPAGTPLSVSWTQSDENILTVDVRAVSQAGAWASRQYVPWAVQFEAVHVNFATGSAEIPASDFAMLHERLAEIVATAERVHEWVEVKLFVAGYTDTVGDASSNQTLSEARARSLGAWFEDNGWTLPIAYQGFGESALAVSTGDSVDEAANRRAVFILSTQTPPTSADIPRTSWRDL